MKGSPVLSPSASADADGDNSTSWGLSAHPKGSRRQASRWRPLTLSRQLDFQLFGEYHNCSRCFFLASLHRP